MWTPDHFATEAAEWELRLVDENPFGLLVSAGAGAPVATHVPMLLHPADRAAAADGLLGCRVLGHLARMNPHWEQISDGVEVLLIFEGPDGYVSPTLYPDAPAAPTWNYTAVHVTGPIRLIHDPEEMLRVINRTIDTVEHPRTNPWDREPSRPYHERIIKGVVAFEVEVASCSSTFKLSQDQWDERRDAVTEDALAEPERRQLGEWMSRSERPGPQRPGHVTPRPPEAGSSSP